MFNLLPRRLVRSRPLGPAGNAAPHIRLTGTQAEVHDALLAAVLGTSSSVMLTGAAGLGKTTVLLAPSRLAEPEQQALRLKKEYGTERASACCSRRFGNGLIGAAMPGADPSW